MRAKRIDSEHKDVFLEKDLKNIHFFLKGEQQERSRVSRELHDGLGQQLIAIKLFTQSLNKTDNKKDTLAIINSAIEDAINECRTISHNLTCPAIEKYGLKKATKLLCEKINNSSSVKITLKNELAKLQAPLEVTIYRTVQELVCNSIKHGMSKKIHISLKSYNKNNTIKLIVTDDGIGINLNHSNDGIGLSNIRSRIDILNGDFKISKMKRGTKALVIIPFGKPN